MISTTVSPGSGSSSSPRAPRSSCAMRHVVHRPVIRVDHRDQPRCPTRPARCSGRGAGGARAAAADLAGDQGEGDQAAHVVGAVACWECPSPRRSSRAFAFAYSRATVRSVAADPADRRHRLGRVARRRARSSSNPRCAPRCRPRRTSPSSMMVWIIALRSATSVPGRNWRRVGGVARELRAARVGHDQLRAALDRVLHEGRGDGVVDRRVGADDDDHVGSLHVANGVDHGARADRLHQRGDRRGVAEPRAVVDVVPAEAGAHQLLEEVRLLVRPFADPKPASARRPSRSRMRRSPPRRGRAPPPTSPRGSGSQGLAGSTWSSASLGTPGLRIKRHVSRCG